MNWTSMLLLVLCLADWGCKGAPEVRASSDAAAPAKPAPTKTPDVAAPPDATALRQAALAGIAKCRWIEGRGMALDCADLNAFRQTPATTPELRILLADADPKVRYLGVERLRVHAGHAWITDPEVAELLVATAETDKSVEVAVYAARLLVWVDTAKTGLAGRIGKLAQDHVVPEVRTVALEWMGSRPDPEFRAALLAVIAKKRPSRAPSRAAWNALAQKPDAEICKLAFGHFEAARRSSRGAAKVLSQVACAPQQDAYIASAQRRLAAGKLDEASVKLVLKLTSTRKMVNQMKLRNLIHEIAQSRKLSARTRILAYSWIWYRDKRSHALVEKAHADPDEAVRKFIGTLLERKTR